MATPEGRRLFDESVPVTRLRLIDSAITSARQRRPDVRATGLTATVSRVQSLSQTT
ncbi:MAG: hypothetical protein JO132_12480 [Streptosporangiaceae bacterium]|nr:hypothetical protein [Streptosporangiaceae bacterium]